MLETLAYTSVAFSLIALGLSTISLLVHYAKRAEHPLITPIQMEIASIRATVVDLVDRVEHFVRRDRARKAREPGMDAMAPDQTLPAPADVKTQLRIAAKQRGLVR
jgi:hypothetical protein